MNSDFLQAESKALVARLGPEPKVEDAYRILFQRAPTPEERKLGMDYVAAPDGGWTRYAQVLLEFERV